jgi:hypothetical protein
MWTGKKQRLYRGGRGQKRVDRSIPGRAGKNVNFEPDMHDVQSPLVPLMVIVIACYFLC